MDSGVLIPLAAMAAVVLIVAIVYVTKIHDLEVRVHQTLYFEQLEHQRQMKELEAKLARARRVAQSGLRSLAP